MLKKNEKNINGPCCIKVPSWVKNKIGNYILYFADHNGTSIKAAYSNNLTGKWKIYKKNFLSINSFEDAINHIASPEIFIDHKNKLFYMLTHSHSKTKKGQWTYLSTSRNGINFDNFYNTPLAPFYLRVFKHKNNFYGISKGGNLWQSKSLFKTFKPRHNLFDKNLSKETLHNSDMSVRHVSVIKKGGHLICFFTRIGDSPERIYFSKCNINNNVQKWKFKKFYEILRPTLKFEGSKIKLKKSKPGDSKVDENAVRDPYILKLKKKSYLFYSVKGERGIALASIFI